MARENYSFIVRAEKEARLALAAKLHKTAERCSAVLRSGRRKCRDSLAHRRHRRPHRPREERSRLSLTGTDPDRLKEEKERGITTDLGFAHLTCGRREVLSFVDVPGHERFVHNMLAGAHGIDAVVLVVAADESVMPQTREHFHICRLLGVRRGVVALTKADLVDADTQAVCAEIEVRERRVRSSPARSVVAVSARTGQGLDELRRSLDALAASAPLARPDGLLRLPVDRVFTFAASGPSSRARSLGERCAWVEDDQRAASARRSRVRGLQVHGAAGRGVRGGQPRRGEPCRSRVSMRSSAATCSPRQGRLCATSMFDVELSLLPSARPLKTDAACASMWRAPRGWRGCGSSDAAAVEPGAAALAQLRLESPGGRGLGRPPDPAQLLAGRDYRRRPRARPASSEEETGRCQGVARARGRGSRGTWCRRPVAARGRRRARAWGGRDGRSTGRAAARPRRPRREYPLDRRSGGRWIARRVFENLAELARAGVEGFHREAPLSAGMPREELRRRSLVRRGARGLRGRCGAAHEGGGSRGRGRSGSPHRNTRFAFRLRRDSFAPGVGRGGARRWPAGRRTSNSSRTWIQIDTAVHRLSRVLLEARTLRHVGGKALVHASAWTLSRRR